MYDASIIDSMSRWENGELDLDETINFFAGLIASGLVWKLQGCYGRTAEKLVTEGFISYDGAVLRYPEW